MPLTIFNWIHWKSYLDCHPIPTNCTTNICTCHDSWAVVTCAKNCSNISITARMRANGISIKFRLWELNVLWNGFPGPASTLIHSMVVWFVLCMSWSIWSWRIKHNSIHTTVCIILHWFTENQDISWYKLCHHWCHWRLLLWQPMVATSDEKKQLAVFRVIILARSVNT